MFEPERGNPIRTFDPIHLQNNDPNTISQIEPMIGNFRFKLDKAIHFPIPTPSLKALERSILYDTLRFTYFEAKVCEELDELNVGFGFSSNLDDEDMDIVGWNDNTVGFHYDNGRVYQENSYTAPFAQKVFLTRVKEDDVFGFLLNHEIGEFQVTRNGLLLENALGNRFTNNNYKIKNFKPMASVRCGKPVEMEINLGLDLVRKPFLYTEIVCVKQRDKLYSMQKNYSDVAIVCKE